MNSARKHQLVFTTLLLAFSLTASSKVEAGCWTCEEEQVLEGVAFVCVGLGSGQAGFANCVPGGDWLGDISCKFSGGYGSCSPSQACPGCRHYPLAVIGRPRPSVVTTQVLLLEFGPHHSGSAVTEIAVDPESGVNPEAIAASLGGPAVSRPAMLGYMVESNWRRTGRPYLFPDGSRLTVNADPLASGFVTVVEVTSADGVQASIERRFTPKGHASVFDIEIGGRACTLAVSSIPGGEDSEALEVATDRLHASFTAAAERYFPKDFLGMSAAASSKSRSAAASAGGKRMASRMLIAQALTPVR